MLKSMFAALAIIVGCADFSVNTRKAHRQHRLELLSERGWLPQQVLWQFI
jgi:hypothetical protein